MPLYRCSLAGCLLAGLRGPSGTCMACSRRFCVEHITASSLHDCPTYESDPRAVDDMAEKNLQAELHELAQRLNLVELARVASSLRNGQGCTIHELDDQYLRTLPRGGMNIHLDIVFNDGVEWICRIRRRSASIQDLPLDAQDAVVLSEAATLLFLANQTSVPVPRVFKVVPPSTRDNLVGVGYLLMEKVAGKPMDWSSLNALSKRKVLEQLADIFHSIYEHPFPLIGCLHINNHPLAAFTSASAFSISHLVAEGALSQKEDGSTGFLGPFTSTCEYLKASVASNTLCVSSRESQTSSISHYLALEKSFNRLASRYNFSATKPENFYLRHMDDKGDHILLDDVYNIVAIIDWEWAQTLPEPLAFSSPLFLVDVAAYYEGQDGLSEDERLFVTVLEEKGHATLAKCVRNGRLAHRLAHLLDTDSDSGDIQIHWESYNRLIS
ncbi:hypothetical protein CPB83DRAFT_863683 [Crepidotus variabilis]|uniref:Aminoglycoside phosphotransferase domain-containing protein n=1 Tax=Crepidotus variabilis TaxID=179855 RepID=A0A9P6E5K7_9AGAR|nr:hypothetical protein CPB83DRAFT_863683 [Crepidotus variabilis]